MEPRRTRIVEFTNCFHVGGGEVQVLELLRQLPDRYQVSVHAIDGRGPLLEETRALGYEPRLHPLKGSLLRCGSAAEIVRLARLLRAEQIELVHAQDFYSTLLGVPAAKLARVPVVISRLDLAHWHGRARHLALAVAAHLADAVIVNCEAVRDLVVYHERVAPRRVVVIRNGLDLPRFDRQRQAPLMAPLPEGQAPVAVLVANLRHEVKRQEDFLKALAWLKRGIHVQGWLVGEGARREELEALARALGLTGVAHFLGGRQDVPAILGRATLGVLCSRQEGLSNAVMEGMASGLPMVVTDAGGNAELVRDGEYGFVVPIEEPEALAQAMLKVLTDPVRGRQMGEAARRFVERELTLERMIDAHDQLYRALSEDRAQRLSAGVRP